MHVRWAQRLADKWPLQGDEWYPAHFVRGVPQIVLHIAMLIPSMMTMLVKLGMASQQEQRRLALHL